MSDSDDFDESIPSRSSLFHKELDNNNNNDNKNNNDNNNNDNNNDFN